MTSEYKSRIYSAETKTDRKIEREKSEWGRWRDRKIDGWIEIEIEREIKRERKKRRKE